MGLVGSKDQSGKVILGNLPPGFLDPKGRELRDKLDSCLQQNMWFFSIGGLLITMPICIKYKTERPFFVAAITCPFADMYYGTVRCAEENNAFEQHYKHLQRLFSQPATQQGPEGRLQQHVQQQEPPRWQPRDEQAQQQEQQRKSWWQW